jgi:hypothetical protein
MKDILQRGPNTQPAPANGVESPAVDEPAEEGLALALDG